jgi:phosphotransferase system IIB component
LIEFLSTARIFMGGDDNFLSPFTCMPRIHFKFGSFRVIVDQDEIDDTVKKIIRHPGSNYQLGLKYYFKIKYTYTVF